MDPSQQVEFRSAPGGRQHVLLRVGRQWVGNCRHARRRSRLVTRHFVGPLWAWAQWFVATHGPERTLDEAGLCHDCCGRSVRDVLQSARTGSRDLDT